MCRCGCPAKTLQTNWADGVNLSSAEYRSLSYSYFFFLLVDSPARVKSLLRTLFSYAPFLFQPLKCCMERPLSPFTQCTRKDTHTRKEALHSQERWWIKLTMYNLYCLKIIAVSTFGRLHFCFVCFFSIPFNKLNKQHYQQDGKYSEKCGKTKNKWQN